METSFLTTFFYIVVFRGAIQLGVPAPWFAQGGPAKVGAYNYIHIFSPNHRHTGCIPLEHHRRQSLKLRRAKTPWFNDIAPIVNFLTV